MVKVVIWGSLQDATGGKAEVAVEAANLRQLLDNLAADFPGLQPQLERGVSVAIDGLVHNDDWFAEIGADSEVVLLPRIEGG